MQVNGRKDMGEIPMEDSMPLSIGGAAYRIVLFDDKYVVFAEDKSRVASTVSFTHAVELAAIDASGVGDAGHARDPRHELFNKTASRRFIDEVSDAMAAGEAFEFSFRKQAFVVTPSKEAGGVFVTTSMGDVPMLVGVYGCDEPDRIVGDAMAGKAMPLSPAGAWKVDAA